MLEDHELRDLPSDPQAAFVAFYGLMQRELRERLNQPIDDGDYSDIYRQYCNAVFGFLEVVQPSGLELPIFD